VTEGKERERETYATEKAKHEPNWNPAGALTVRRGAASSANPNRQYKEHRDTADQQEQREKAHPLGLSAWRHARMSRS
jgi:hypothetical protein